MLDRPLCREEFWFDCGASKLVGPCMQNQSPPTTAGFLLAYSTGAFGLREVNLLSGEELCQNYFTALLKKFYTERKEFAPKVSKFFLI